MNEIARANAFIAAKLLADTQLTTLVGQRVFAHPAPPETDWPVVTFVPLSGPDTTATGGTRVLTRPLYLVRGIDKGGAYPSAIADRIDAVLQAAAGPAGSDAYVAGIVRENAFEWSEEQQGTVYRHLGGRYRVNIHAA